jgi:DNA-binding MarR family transcriptional regulator
MTRSDPSPQIERPDSPQPMPTPAPALALDGPAFRVLRQFRQVFSAVRTHFHQVEKAAGLGGAALWALSLIAAEEGLGVTRLARAMGIHQSTASNLVKPLVERGFVAANKGSGSDRRTVALTATAAGHALLARAPAPFTGVLPQALSGLDEATLVRLEADLGQLLALLGADAAAADEPLGL